MHTLIHNYSILLLTNTTKIKKIKDKIILAPLYLLLKKKKKKYNFTTFDCTAF